MFKNVVAVSNRHLCSIPLEKQIERVCTCHPRAIVLREKDLSEEEYKNLAKRVIEVCERYQVPCILHTFAAAAKSLNHQAIHLPLPLLRTRHDKSECFNLIGTSVHSLEEAQEAVRHGADYLTVGHIYRTDCKKGLEPRGIDFLTQICRLVNIPVYAIGGIGLDEVQMTEIVTAGAEGSFIMSSMMRL